MKIYISSAKESGKSLNLMAGDTDYVAILLRDLKTKLNPIEVLLIEDDMRQKARAEGRPPVIKGDDIIDELLNRREPGIFHLMLNLPFTGAAYKPEHLQKLKEKGYKVVVSCIEFMRYVGRDEPSQRKAVELINLADQVIFLDKPDQQAAIAFLETQKSSSSSSSALADEKASDSMALKNIKDATIIPVPCTTPTTQTDWAKRPANVISFGTIRRGKGLPHLIKLAELFKAADANKEDKDKRQVIIAGSMEPQFYVEGFTDAMKRIFPKHAHEIDVLEKRWLEASKSKDKSKKDELVSVVTMEIRHKITEWQNNPSEISLPVKYYFDTKPEQVPDLFEQARYAFLPAYRGFTLRNTSISTALESGCVTYSHVTNITPYQYPLDAASPIVLIPDVVSEFEKNPHFDKFEYADGEGGVYAMSVFKDIEAREKDIYPTMTKTIPALKKLVQETIALDHITDEIVGVYQKTGVELRAGRNMSHTK
jgi:hypothetical protein